MNNESSGGVWPPLIAFWQNRIHILTAKLIDSLSMDHSKQVVVCGDGVIEVCTAYFLAVKGVYIMLIEKFNVACTAFEKAGRFLALNWCNRGPLEELAHMSFNLHRSLFEELDGSWSYSYRTLTTLSLIVTEFEGSFSATSMLSSWVDRPTRGWNHRNDSAGAPMALHSRADW